jgi:hypothetical protein
VRLADGRHPVVTDVPRGNRLAEHS